MKGRVNVGAMANRGASAALNRPGNSTAEKIKAFSGPTNGGIFPPMSSLPKNDQSPGLNIKGPPASHYQIVRRESEPVKENANQIDTNIFIGNSASAEDWGWLKSQGVTHIVNTAGEIPNFFSKEEFRYFNLKLKDNPTYGDEDLLRILEPTFRYIAGVIKFNPLAKILVHCHMGKSRSASIVIYYLMRTRGWSYVEALEFAKSKRSIIAPNSWYTKQLQDAEILFRETKR